MWEEHKIVICLLMKILNFEPTHEDQTNLSVFLCNKTENFYSISNFSYSP